jgi:cobalt/nickel transport system ATP-binding protein
MIDIRDLSFSYHHGKKVFKGFNFSLKKGQRIGIIGPNGSGKTTLFHLIMGLLKPASGEIKVFGKVRVREKDFMEVRQRIGLLFQDSDDQLFCPTVEEDIAFGPLNLGKSREQVRQIVRESCERLDLKGLEKEITHRLSAGQKRLVALTSVIAMQPECFLLDEPTAGLDREATEKLLGYLKEHANTYVIASHDLEFLRAATDTIYILKDGTMGALTPLA